MTSCQIGRDRLAGALWSLFAGDALASPAHWYYDTRLIREHYGEIIDYTKPAERLPGSIMANSNTDGAGRGQYNPKKKTVIGDVINHGKKKYWSPSGSYHYHCTLEKGENTLEAQLVRVLLKSIQKSRSTDTWADTFRREYIDFMTTPNSHNDAYASTAHRMFFRNLVRGIPAENAPDNDGHNVDTIDGLILPTVSALAAAYLGQSRADVRGVAVETVRVTRNSSALEAAAEVWADLLFDVFTASENDNNLLSDARLIDTAARLGVRLPSVSAPDPVVS